MPVTITTQNSIQKVSVMPDLLMKVELKGFLTTNVLETWTIERELSHPDNSYRRE